MSDRTVIALATVPMIAGALLLVALQRVPPLKVSASAAKASSSLGSPQKAAESVWLGVVVAGQTAELAAGQDGRVTDVWARAGTRVRKGQRILQIDGSSAANDEALAGAELGQRRSEVSRAEARHQEASAKLARLQQGGTWIAAQELESARAAERMAKADLLAAQAGVGMGRARMAQQKLRSRRHTLESPFDGVLVSCDVDPGDSVAASTVVARVITDDRQVRFAFPRDQLPTSGVMDVLLALPSGSQRTKVTSLQPEVDPAAQMIFATATPSLGESNLMPGTRVEVRPVEQPPQATLEGR
jgi:RND family efflux transporter MFP subunit